MTKVYNRKLKRIEEVKHIGKNALEVVYSNKFNTWLATNRVVSKVYGIHNKTIFSKNKINKFIKENNIDMSLFEDKKYKNFNEFFIRKYKSLSFDNDFVSPCDAKLLVYKINSDLVVKVKNFEYTMEDLFNRNIDDFKDGYMFVYRLSVDDCHRYYYIDNGTLESRVHIKGKFHTVSETSSNYKIYKENEREYSILNTENYGKIIYMEVGAMMIGKIVNHNLSSFKKGDEKGFFLPGASTIIVVCKDIKVDDDILEYSSKGIETLVSIGEKVGEKIC